MYKVIPFLVLYTLITLVSYFQFKTTPPSPQPTPTLNPTSLPNPTSTFLTSPSPLPTSLPTLIHQQIPFTSQAPSAQWNNPLFQDGCEEASIIIAMGWIKQQPTLEKSFVEQEIENLATFQQQTFGTSTDTSAQDTAETIRSYYHHQNLNIIQNPTTKDLINALHQNQLIIVPANGRLLGNPNFTPPGPERHMLVIIGHDDITKEFITHDPGTRLGANYRYSSDVLMSAVADYPTGEHLPNLNPGKTAIIIAKN